MSKALLDQYLKRLKLSTVARNYERAAEEADSGNVSYEDYLCTLLEQEVESRDSSRRKERITRAKFPSLKTLETFKFEEVPALDKKCVLKLFKGQYVAEAESVIFIGPHGVGKTHLAIALGVQACQDGKTVRFFTAGELVHLLVEAKDELKVLKLQGDLSKTDVLIVDELGMADCNAEEAKLLFQVLNARYEKRATIITTNLEFADWTSVFCTKQLTSAVLDRLTHRCHIVAIEGESYRFKEGLRRNKRNPAA
jgi:DNA replication protein DnaC